MDGYRTLARAGLVVGLVGAELFLAHDLTASGGVTGYTLTRETAVAPQTRARVHELRVQLGATVAAGAPLAELDPTETDNAIEEATAAREHAIAAIAAHLTQRKLDVENIARRFDSSAERATADLAAADASAHTAAAELAAIEAELTAQRELVAQHLAPATTANALELRRAALAKQVATADHTLSVLRDNAAAAGARKTGWSDTTDNSLAPLEAELREADIKLAQLRREREALTVRAPVGGVVEQLPLRPGDLAGPDAPVAVISAADTQRVVACVPEARADAIAVGQEAELTSAYEHAHATGAVESVTSAIGPLPPRCQPPGSKAIALGRVAVVALDAPASGLPGETQIVHFAARRRPQPTRSATPVAASASSASGFDRMTVPGAILARSRFEPSGLVWFAPLDRYVIVSDDTGFPDRDNHAPWLFTMTADGVVDPAPLVIGGVGEVNDLESIAAEGDRTLWVLSSQSVNKKGNRSAARQLLVRATYDAAKGLTATGTVHLADLLDRADASVRAGLGVSDTRALDIEAMAMHDGALYLGLKAPVDADGHARIWRVAHPDRLLAGDLAGADVAIWATIALAVEADGRTVPGGIADLLFDGDRLLIGATASGLDPQMQTGALYVARAAAGELVAERVRAFADRKPEGLALAPDGTHLAVAFDRGAEPAEWTQLPLAELRGAHAAR